MNKVFQVIEFRFNAGLGTSITRQVKGGLNKGEANALSLELNSKQAMNTGDVIISYTVKPQ